MKRAKDTADQTALFPELKAEPDSGPVECLGMSFESDEARRAYFLERLQEELPELRKRPDFPLAEDEDILRLSDPPYYTACPNPFAAQLVEFHGRAYDPKDDYKAGVFATDVSVGKSDPVYTAHSYHTKVPHKAIARYILQYTEPGDIVLDGFCGSGMTGVALQACACPDSYFKSEIKAEYPDVSWGKRYGVLSDLAPAATFLAHCFTQKAYVPVFDQAVEEVVSRAEAAVGWMFRTHDSGSPKKRGRTVSDSYKRVGSVPGTINYTVWSDVLTCPQCSEDVVYWKAALDAEKGAARQTFSCPTCTAILDKRTAAKVRETIYDPVLQRSVTRGKRIPVLIAYSVARARFEKEPEPQDIDLCRKIESLPSDELIPVYRMMHQDPPWGDQWREGYHFDVTHAHHLFTPRNLRACAAILRAIDEVAKEKWLRDALIFVFTAMMRSVSRLASIAFSYYFRGGGGAINAGTKGTLYISSTVPEVNPLASFRSRANSIRSVLSENETSCIITTGSCSDLHVPDSSVDYIFIDPPFGHNLVYSELNFLWEAWLRVFTAQVPEMIVSRFQEKSLADYQQGMYAAFRELNRVLKPGRWITVVFHNSQNAVWNAIQETMGASGFVIADVRVLDKKQGSYNQYVARSSVNKDLVISAYKPNGGLEERFELDAGTEEGAWEFVRAHLQHLPIFVSRGDLAEPVVERQSFLLFDRMVAFHVQRGVTVPLSAAEFYGGLAQRFTERDGMYFLSDQVAEYDRKRMTVKEVLQLELFVKDEESAIQWLNQQLLMKPQTFQDIHPQFLKELGGWEKHERPLELLDLLQESFLRYDGKDEVPSQIHSYLSSNFKELRGLAKDDIALRAKAKDRWYVPDPRKAGDLEKLRERALLREFEEYRESKQKKLKIFRLEAARAGFKRAWQERDYATIIAVARKIPENVLQEDPKLLMWFDQALTRTGEDA